MIIEQEWRLKIVILLYYFTLVFDDSCVVYYTNTG